MSKITSSLVIFIMAGFSLINLHAEEIKTGESPALVIRQNILEVWAAEVGKAQETLQIATYKFTSPRALEALIEAIERGVEITLVLDAKEAHDDKSLAQEAVQAGIEVVYWPTEFLGKLHVKLYIIDSKQVLFGSFNLSKSAQSGNTELLYRVETAAEVTAFKKQWRALYESSLPVNPIKFNR